LVRPAAAGHDVVPDSSEQSVISRSAVERIGPITTIQGIVPATGVQHIVVKAPHQGIVAAPPQQRIVPLPTIDGVVACAAIEGVGTAITHKDVVQTITGAIEVGGPRQGQILDVATQCPGGSPHYRIDAAIEILHDLVSSTDDVGIVAGSAGEYIATAHADRDVGQ